MMKHALLIFLKNNIPGKVKTRLAATIGTDEAIRVYNTLVQHTQLVTSDLKENKIVFYSAYVDQDDIWNHNNYTKQIQRGSDLGERMSNAFQFAFDSGNNKVVIIGTDCPGINKDLIQKAFKELIDADVVIGPAMDGGYYLLGMKKCYSELFNDIAWSTSEVLEATVKKCKQLNLHYHLLEMLPDVDEEKDLVYMKGLQRISIIIPTYNEEENIDKTLKSIQLNGNGNLIKEIIVVDGGSTDKTIEKAIDCGARIIVSKKKGRAAQMNEGAAAASEKILHFIHADSQLPQHFDADVVKAVNNGYEAGCFRLAFDYDHWFLKLNCWFTRFDRSAFHYGDQSLFITRDLFNKVHGFNEKYIVFEDLDIIRRIKNHCKFKIHKKNIITSARKYVENGVFKMQMVFYKMYIMEQLGASQKMLVNVLRTNIKQDKI